MFGRKKSRSERPFSLMLAEELLRAELKRLYGGSIKFFQCDIVAKNLEIDAGLETSEETDYRHSYGTAGMKAKLISINAIIGPIGRFLKRVEAECRVFTFAQSAANWKPHFLWMVIKSEDGVVDISTNEFCYQAGRTHGGFFFEKNAENPCLDMCASQTAANYPGLNKELHGIK